MKTLKWLFAKKEDETELDPVKRLKAQLKLPIKTFHDFFFELEKKKQLLDKIKFEGMTNFFNDKKIRDPVKIRNIRLLTSLRNVLKMENFDEMLLKRLLVESATRLHHIADDINIKIFTKTYRTNNIEEAKRRSYEIVKNEENLKKLAEVTSPMFNNIRALLNEYFRILEGQNSSMDKNANTYAQFLQQEKKVLDRLVVKFKRFIIFVLARSKKIVDVRNIDLMKESVLSMNEAAKEAVLIFQSYANTPQENREMAGFFADRGHSVFTPRFPGHGTTQDEFYNTSIQEIKQFGQQALDYFYKKNGEKPFFVTGLSLGGMLTLHLASKKENFPKIKGIIPINAFIKSPIHNIFEKIPYGMKALKYFLKKSKKTFITKRSTVLMMRKIKRRVKNFAIYITKYKQYGPSFEDEFIKEYRERVDKDFKDIIEDQIKEEPERQKELLQDFEIVKDRLEKKMRVKFREGKFGSMHIQDITQLLEYEFYNVMTPKGLVQLNNFADELLGEMPSIIAPLFVIQAKNDGTVHPRSAKIILKKCNSSIKRIKMVDNAGHVLILEKQRYYVFKLIERFIQRVIKDQTKPVAKKQSFKTKKLSAA